MYEPALRVGFAGVAVHVIVAGPAQAGQVVKAIGYGLISGSPHLPWLAMVHVGGVQSAALAFPVIAVSCLFFRCLPVHTASPDSQSSILT